MFPAAYSPAARTALLYLTFLSAVALIAQTGIYDLQRRVVEVLVARVILSYALKLSAKSLILQRTNQDFGLPLVLVSSLAKKGML